LLSAKLDIFSGEGNIFDEVYAVSLRDATSDETDVLRGSLVIVTLVYNREKGNERGNVAATRKGGQRSDTRFIFSCR
jgi:hypothetical protein